MVISCAHNFFHMKDNWRMHYFDLCFSTSREWRISHALSHHLYTNTANDCELSSLLPLWDLLPRPDKTLLQRYGSYIYELVLMPIAPFCKYMVQICQTCFMSRPLYPWEFAQFSVLLLMALFSQSFWLALK